MLGGLGRAPRDHSEGWSTAGSALQRTNPPQRPLCPPRSPRPFLTPAPHFPAAFSLAAPPSELLFTPFPAWLRPTLRGSRCPRWCTARRLADPAVWMDTRVNARSAFRFFALHAFAVPLTALPDAWRPAASPHPWYLLAIFPHPHPTLNLQPGVPPPQPQLPALSPNLPCSRRSSPQQPLLLLGGTPCPSPATHAHCLIAVALIAPSTGHCHLLGSHLPPATSCDAR